MKFIPYAKQSIDKVDIQAAVKALENDIVTRGCLVEEFEKTVAEFCGAKYAVAFNSGSTALFAASFAAKINAFDHFITSPNTFVATATAGTQRDAKLHLIDIDRNNGLMDLQKLKAFLKELRLTRGRLIITPVHFAGITLDMRELNKIINFPDTIVIEDAAHAIGSTYPSGENVGSCHYSDMTIFSFHPAKTITTLEGGMVTTNSEELKEALKLYRNNGIQRENLESSLYPGYYEVISEGGNYHLTELQAALGLSQLNRMDTFIKKRRELVKLYRTQFTSLPQVRLFSESYDERSAYHLFVIQMDYKALKTTRSEVMKKLKEKGIGTQVHYIPLYKQPIFTKNDSVLDEMEHYFDEALTLPLYYDLTEEEVVFIVKTLKEVLRIG
jgi:dTDP-4-amino-4,6-dideoxygalactose transaminase